MRDLRPIPQSSGSLQPPDRHPPTAVGIGTPEPEPLPRSEWSRSPKRKRTLLGAVARLTLGTAVALAGIAAHAVRGRARARR